MSTTRMTALLPFVVAVVSELALGPTSAMGQESDTAFTSLQERGRSAMGVDQYTSTHRFDDLPDGGRIELQQDQPDSAGVRAIRAHLATTARAFAAGNFTKPGMVHAQSVPGTVTMAIRRHRIRYQFRPLPAGGEVRIITRDPQALEAIHSFLAFQRREHRAVRRYTAVERSAHAP